MLLLLLLCCSSSRKRSTCSRSPTRRPVNCSGGRSARSGTAGLAACSARKPRACAAELRSGGHLARQPTGATRWRPQARAQRACSIRRGQRTARTRSCTCTRRSCGFRRCRGGSGLRLLLRLVPHLAPHQRCSGVPLRNAHELAAAGGRHRRRFCSCERGVPGAAGAVGLLLRRSARLAALLGAAEGGRSSRSTGACGSCCR